MVQGQKTGFVKLLWLCKGYKQSSVLTLVNISTHSSAVKDAIQPLLLVQSSVLAGLSLCSRPSTIFQVMNVLNEVASVTANRLVCRYLSHTNKQFLLQAVIDASVRRAVLLSTCYCSQTNQSYSCSLPSHFMSPRTANTHGGGCIYKCALSQT